MPKKRRPYVWVTWITGLLAGDDRCEYAAWYKAWHHDYPKVPGDSNLSKWKSDHADAVNVRVAELKAAGLTVFVEGENKFIVKGDTNTLSAGPDIVALSTDAAVAVVEDVKTGRHKDSHVWQVVVYMLFLPAVHDALKGRRVALRGRLLYNDGPQDIPASQADLDAMRRVGSLMRRLASRDPLPASPSPGECRYCDIAECEHRVSDEVAKVETKHF